MKFNAAAITLLSAVGIATAAALPASSESQTSEHMLMKRNPYAIAIISAVISPLVTKAVNEAVGVIGDIQDWTKAREQFTQSTVRTMWQNKPSNANAAICYNMDYKVSNRGEMSDLTSVTLKKGPLHVNYDCFYLRGPDNHFNSEGDGGYVNLAVITSGNCSFDGKTSDVYCK